MGAGGRTAPAAAPGAPAWPAALGIAATIAGGSEDSVNAERCRTECGAAAMRGHPSDRTPEDRAGVRDPAPRRAAPARRKRGLRGRRARASRISWGPSRSKPASWQWLAPGLFAIVEEIIDAAGQFRSLAERWEARKRRLEGTTQGSAAQKMLSFQFIVCTGPHRSDYTELLFPGLG